MKTNLQWRNAAVFLYLLLTAVPITVGLGYALLYSLGLVGLLGRGFTLAHWMAVLGGTEFWLSLGLSAGIALVSMSISTVLALTAVLYWRGGLLRGALSYAVYLPLVFPATVVAFLVFQWLSNAGLLARLSYRFGWTAGATDFPNLINDPYGIGIITAHVLMAMPFLTILFANLYRSERVEALSQVATTLGAGRADIRRRIVLPVLLRRARPTLLLYGIFVLSSYEIPLLLGRQSPQMLSVLTIRKLQRFDLTDIPQAYVISVCYAVLLVALLVLWRVARSVRARGSG